MIYHPSQHGFTLIEVLVAITILLLVVTGPMKILTSSNHSTAFATEQVNAFFLAQEGLELAEKGRDDLMLQYYKQQNYSGTPVQPWTTFKGRFSNCIGAGKTCDLTIDKTAHANLHVTACTGTACVLYIDSSTKHRTVYTHTSSPSSTETPTLYTRKIHMVPVMANGKVKEVLVTATVTWRTGSLIADQSVILKTYLENVYDIK